ncbi:MAG: hypothetical protein EAZ89_20100 [Bacteroidetes bacterium]|nr:MAG: hypothetical protein EAZ89_20100 [Bacteroidota bacterium]
MTGFREQITEFAGEWSLTRTLYLTESGLQPRPLSTFFNKKCNFLFRNPKCCKKCNSLSFRSRFCCKKCNY